MNWKITLLIIGLAILFSLAPVLNQTYDFKTGAVVGLLISILGLIIRMIYLINSRIAERNSDDLLLTKVRKNTNRNDQVEKLISIQDNLINSNDIINKNVSSKLESYFDYANAAVSTKTITDKTESLLIELYKEFNGNIYILSKNEVCENFWCSPVGDDILKINLELADKKTFMGLGKPKCNIERIFIQNAEPTGSTKASIEKQVSSNIKCFKVEEKDIEHIQFCDAVIFENFAVCETQINNKKEPDEYKIMFTASRIREFQELYEKVKSKSVKLN